MDNCRNCEHLGVTPDKRGRLIPRADRPYECCAPIAPAPPLPWACDQPVWPPHRRNVWIDQGEGCALHEPRKPKG
jgi:hypothetical protein